MDSRFVEQIIKAVEAEAREKLGDGIRVETGKVVKTNDGILHSIVLREGKSGVSPTIYLENYMNDYLEGKPFSEIAEKIVEAHRQASERTPDYSGMSFAYENIEGRLEMQCVEIARNRERLKSAVHRPVGNGFTMMAYIVVEETADGIMKAPVTKAMAAHEGYDVAKLLDRAYENTVRKNGPVLTDMHDIIMSGGKTANGVNPCDRDARIGSPIDLFVLSGSGKTNGAGALFYPGVQNRIGEILGCSYYVIPSSIHEVIIAPDRGRHDPDELREMLESGNRTLVSPQEILSDRIFRYDRQRQKLTEPKAEQRREERGER